MKLLDGMRAIETEARAEARKRLLEITYRAHAPFDNDAVEAVNACRELGLDSRAVEALATLAELESQHEALADAHDSLQMAHATAKHEKSSIDGEVMRDREAQMKRLDQIAAGAAVSVNVLQNAVSHAGNSTSAVRQITALREAILDGKEPGATLANAVRQIPTPEPDAKRMQRIAKAEELLARAHEIRADVKLAGALGREAHALLITAKPHAIGDELDALIEKAERFVHIATYRGERGA